MFRDMVREMKERNQTDTNYINLDSDEDKLSPKKPKQKGQSSVNQKKAMDREIQDGLNLERAIVISPQPIVALTPEVFEGCYIDNLSNKKSKYRYIDINV